MTMTSSDSIRRETEVTIKKTKDTHDDEMGQGITGMAQNCPNWQGKEDLGNSVRIIWSKLGERGAASEMCGSSGSTMIFF